MGQVELPSCGTDGAVPSLSSPVLELRNRGSGLVSQWLQFLGHYLTWLIHILLSPSLKDYEAQATIKWQQSSCLSLPNIEMMSITLGLNYAWLFVLKSHVHRINSRFRKIT